MSVELPAVHEAWAAVMADVQAIALGDRMEQPGQTYAYRGARRLVNAVGPALRAHRVTVVPIAVTPVFTDRQVPRTDRYGVQLTGRNSEPALPRSERECVITVTWLVTGPAGDTLPPMMSVGQGVDGQGKSVAKAMTVAQRMLYESALHIPTECDDVADDAPTSGGGWADPWATATPAPAPVPAPGNEDSPQAQSYVPAIKHAGTNKDLLRPLFKEMSGHGLLDQPVDIDGETLIAREWIVSLAGKE